MMFKSKPCRVCKTVFQPVSAGNTYCPPCGKEARRSRHAKGQREWRKQNPVRHARAKANHDLKQYGLTLADYQLMLQRQKGRCAICRTAKPKGRGVTRPFAVDHCHETDKVRALLCHRCNGALGMVGDDTAILERMISYLQEHDL